MHGGLLDRMIRAAKLDATLYEEVEADSSATGQAALVVVISSFAAGVGAVALEMEGWLVALLVGTVTALVGWLLWALLTYLIGTRLLPGARTEATYGQLLRTIGFSASPGLIRVIGLVPFLRGIVFLVASVWMFVAMVVAVRQALDYDSTLRALGVVLIGWVVQVVFLLLALYLVGGTAGLPQGP